MKAADLFLLVSMKLQDLGPQAERRWPWEVDPSGLKASLTDFLNAALRQLSLVRPDVFAVTESVRLVAGVRQTLPDPAVHGCQSKAAMLMDLVCNMGADGQTRGWPIVRASREALSAIDWSETGPVVRNLAYDPRADPGVVYVVPGGGASETVWVEAVFSAKPGAVAGSSADLPVPDSFAGPLEHWILYEVYSGDNSTSNQAKAQFHFRSFFDSLGVKLQSERYFKPQAVESEGV
jgi:hypothetical protein